MTEFDNVFVVTYYDKEEDEPTVTVFSNEEAAKKYYEFMICKHDITSIDECPIYNKFIIKKGEDK